METDFASMVEDDAARGVFRVKRRALVEPQVLDAERRAIFDRCWLYVGHASEVGKVGDYVTRQVGGRPVVLVRSSHERIDVLLNACPHRGNIVCRERGGHASAFTCFYHAWTFELDGTLKRVAFDEAYKSLDREAMAMPRPAQQADYRGLIFLNFSAEAPSFLEYLGNAKEALDSILDYSDTRQLVAGGQRYSIRSNWKLLVENSIDTYHALVVHQRYLSKYMRLSNEEQMRLMRGEAAGRGRQLDNGHAVMETPIFRTPIASQSDTLSNHRQGLVARHGEARASEIADVTRNLFLFPNFIFISNWHTVRTFEPVSPGYMEVTSWGLLPGGESAEMRKARVDNFVSFLGPAGFGTPDDVEALEGCQRGYAADPDAWSDLSRGMGREVPLASDELQMRSFWRRWRDMLQAHHLGDDTPLRSQPACSA